MKSIVSLDSVDRSRVAAMLVTFASCASLACMTPPRPPGMIATAPRAHAAEPALEELARVEGRADQRSLLVVHPKSACSGSASTVLLDEDGSFVGAIPPGTASLLDIPSRTRLLTAISSVDVTAPVASWTFALVVPVPPEPEGLLLSASRFNARECGNGQYAEVRLASKAELESALAEAEITWLEPRREAGQAWLDAHHERVAEVLGVPRRATPDVVAQLRGGRQRR